MKFSLIGLCVLAGLAIGCRSSQPPPEVADYPYHEPLLSPGTKFGGLPPAVQRSVRAQAGAAELYDVAKATTINGVVYEVMFRDPKLYPSLYLAPDGSVIAPDLLTVVVAADEDTIGPRSGGAVDGLRLSDLPSKVVATIQEKVPTAEV